MSDECRFNIYFKSGQKQTIVCTELTVTRNANEIIRLAWTGLSKPKSVMYINIAEIEYIERTA